MWAQVSPSPPQRGLSGWEPSAGAESPPVLRRSGQASGTAAAFPVQEESGSWPFFQARRFALL